MMSLTRLQSKENLGRTRKEVVPLFYVP
uniref:Uncharacterized protein n=1 Tax=Arundo donax TaxID=35708 RepID=A0A0A8Z4Z7_ARUDO